MQRIKLFFIIQISISVLWAGTAYGQTSVNTNGGSASLYQANNTNYYQSSYGAQQPTYNLGQSAGASSSLLQSTNNTNNIVSIDPSSAPAFSPQVVNKANYKLIYLAAVLVVFGAAITLIAAFQRPKKLTQKSLDTPEEPKISGPVEETVDEEPQEKPTEEKVDKPKQKKKKKNKKHHR